jgi:hypothetical protein
VRIVNTANHLGKLGESIVSRLFHLEISGTYRFSTCFLGAKAQFDLLVNLLDERGLEYGPFFFVQIKTTASLNTARHGIPVRLRASHVKLAKARKVPVYLLAVRSVDGSLEEVYAIAVDGSLTHGLAVVPRLFSLRSEETRLTIYNEVHQYFQSGLKSFTSNLTWKEVDNGSG